jgi:hypothetical protein
LRLGAIILLNMCVLAQQLAQGRQARRISAVDADNLKVRVTAGAGQQDEQQHAVGFGLPGEGEGLRF